MTQNHYSQDRTKHLRITFTLFLTYITNFMFKPKITLEFYDLIRIFSYKSQSQGGDHTLLQSKPPPQKQNSSCKPASISPYASSVHASAHRTARFHPSNFRLRCASVISA